MDIFPTSAAVCGIEITYCPRMRGSVPRPLNVFAQTGRKKEPHGGSGQFWAGLPAGRGTWGRGDVGRGESRPEAKPQLLGKSSR